MNERTYNTLTGVSLGVTVVSVFVSPTTGVWRSIALIAAVLSCGVSAYLYLRYGSPAGQPDVVDAESPDATVRTQQPMNAPVSLANRIATVATVVSRGTTVEVVTRGQLEPLVVPWSRHLSPDSSGTDRHRLYFQAVLLLRESHADKVVATISRRLESHQGLEISFDTRSGRVTIVKPRKVSGDFDESLPAYWLKLPDFQAQPKRRAPQRPTFEDAPHAYPSLFSGLNPT